MHRSRGRVIVLGGTGLVGGALTDRLSLEADRVVVADRRHTTDSGLEFYPIDVSKRGALTELLRQVPADLVVNAINLATVFSEQGYAGYQGLVGYHAELFSALSQGPRPLTYLQVGTTGAGGLGFDIPFTHGGRIEDLPIIHKAAFAGMSSQLLVLTARSFASQPVRIIEVKPGLAIFGERILTQTQGALQIVTLDGGESGPYTADELALLTQFMGFTTVGRIVDKIVDTLDRSSAPGPGAGYDVTGALNQAIVSQDATDMALRDGTLARMRCELDGRPVLPATGNLGPPTITRDLMLAAALVAGQGLDGAIVTDMLDYLRSTRGPLDAALAPESLRLAMAEMRPRVRAAENLEPWEIVARALKERTSKRNLDVY